VRAALQQTMAVYRLADAAYAPFSCPASGECCQLSKTGREPWLWLPEWLLLLEHVRRERGGELPADRADGGCPFLDAAGRRCTVYADRPLGCRTYFCHRVKGPSREPLETMVALSRRLEHAAAALAGDGPVEGPRPLTEWVRRYRPA